MSDTSSLPATTHARPSYPRLVVGLTIVAAGIVFTLQRMGKLPIRLEDLIAVYWPIVFVMIGLAHMLQSRSLTGCCGGFVWVVVGAWWIAYNAGWTDYGIDELWPVVLVVLGLWIIVNGFRRRGGGEIVKGNADTGSVVNALAVMSGVTRRPTTRDFRGGELMAFMGGAKVDLRDAAIAAGEARIDVMTVWGGIEILVPETWTVEMKVFPLMGGADDRTTPPAGGSNQRLVISGLVVMGGVDVKNTPRP